MSVPDHRRIVEQVFAGGGYTLTTKAGAGLFTEAAAVALHAADSNWGHLLKPEGRTHVVDAQGNRHAVDVVLYKSTGQIVDIISGAGDPGARLAWSVGPEGEYGDGEWYAPVGSGAPPLEPPSPPVQPPVTGTPPPPAGPIIEIDLGGVLAKVAALEASDERRYRDLVNRLNALHELLKDLPVAFEGRVPYLGSFTLTGKPR